jgi:hypothetical protein
MKETEIIRLKDDVQLNNPIMFVGLPGVGHVGKLVVEHLMENLEGEKVIEIYSPYFPPQVLVNKDNTIKLVNNEIYACNINGQDILILAGDHQSSTNEGHYELGSLYLDLAEEFGVSRIYTLGGFPTGEFNHNEGVIGAVNNINLVEELEGYGVEFRENEPGNGIVGASGLILGLCDFRNIDAACLMGLTSGYIVDPKSAQSILRVIDRILDIEIDEEELEKRAKEMEKVVEKIKTMKEQQDSGNLPQKDEDINYII